MKRIYKTKSPEETISKIKEILNKLKLTTFESNWSNPIDGVYSLRVETVFEQGSFGQNGKGLSTQYAMASAYAEFMERLQNLAYLGPSAIPDIFYSDFETKYGYVFFPDEVYLSKDDFLNLPNEYLHDLIGKKDVSNDDIRYFIDPYYERLSAKNKRGIIAVPFYDCSTKQIVNLPFNFNFFLTGSNGMAAGNCMSEGVFQGICEILERYAAAEVYYKRLTPPTIPHSFLNEYSEEWAIITQIQNLGYDVIVKDFSCNKNLPVIGTIIVDKEKQKYRLNVGSDTCFKVALSRTLTEIFQGISDKEMFDSLSHQIPQEEHEYFLNDSPESIKMRDDQLLLFSINSSGVFPRSLFEDDYSYDFSFDTFVEMETYDKEVYRLIDLIQSLGHKVYLRDVSFLGFPSYYVYVTEMSRLGRKSDQSLEPLNIAKNIINDKLSTSLIPFNDFISNKDTIKEFCHNITDNKYNITKIHMHSLFKIKVKEEHYWSVIPLSYFVTLFYYILKDYTAAKHYLNMFVKTSLNENENYYKFVYSLFDCMEKQIDINQSSNYIPHEVIEDFKHNNLFHNIIIPQCPHCSICDLKEDCYTQGIIKIHEIVLSNSAPSKIKQDNFNSILKNNK